MFTIFKTYRIVRRRRRRVRVKDTSWEEYKKPAEELVNTLIEEVNTNGFFVYKNITIRNQTTRWGSCSSKGNLNFNYKIVKLPYDLAKYLVVHELCHLKHLNHSKTYWELVETILPNYKTLQADLKKIRL